MKRYYWPALVVVVALVFAMFSVQVMAEGISKTMQVRNPDGELSQLTYVCGKDAFMTIFSTISDGDAKAMWNDFMVLTTTTKIRTVHIYMMTPGGSAFAGLAIADQLEQARKSGYTLHAYAYGVIASAAVPVFAVCTTRTAAPGTLFMVHQASMFKFLTNESAADIRAQNDMMDMLSNKYLGNLVRHSKLSLVEWKALETKTTWFSAEQALQWGLVDKVE